MECRIIIINILYYLFNNNNINCGCLCKKLSCKNDDRRINEELRKENNNQKKENDEENEEKKRKDDILKKKREKLLEKYNRVNDLNKTLPENKRIYLGNPSLINSYSEAQVDIDDKEYDKKEQEIKNILKEIDIEEYKKQLKNQIIQLVDEVQKLINNNFTKYFKKINIKNDIDKKKIEKEDDDKKLETILNDLKNEKDEVEKLIKEDEEKDKYFCKTKEEFIDKFNERKNILADSFFINNDLKNNLKSNNLKEDESDDYYKMYSEMTKDVFNHQIALDLQIYRYILKLEGFIKALDDIFNLDVKLHIPTIAYNEIGVINSIEGVKCGDKYYFSKKDLDDLNVIFDKKELKGINFTTKYDDIQFDDLDEKTRNFIDYVNDKNKFLGNKIGDETKVTEIEKKLIYINNKLGEITVEDEKFKYLRCKDGCKNGDNCVSCKLRKLLEKENCLDTFKNIYKQQGEGSDKPEAMLMKRIIYDGLKKDKKYDFYSLNFNGRKENFCKEISNEFRKCVMIEWALTIGFMKKFIYNYYKSDNFNLYRTFNYIDSVENIKSDIYESTSLVGNFFIGLHDKNINMISYAGSFFTKIENVKYYKCLFNYIISPTEKTILKEDSEVEIGFIGIDEKYVENKIVNYEEDQYGIAKQYIKYLEKTRKENFDKIYVKDKWEEIDVSKLNKKK